MTDPGSELVRSPAEADLEKLERVRLLIETEPVALVPLLGILLDLRQLPEVAEALELVRNAKRQLDEMRGLLEDVLRAESIRQGTKTLRLEGGIVAEVSGGTKPDYDVERLLELLRAAGMPEERLSELVVETVSYRVDGKVARSVAGANPDYRSALEECRIDRPAPWRVSTRRES